MSFEAIEFAFWKQKLLEREREQVEYMRRVYAHEAALPRGKRLIKDADPTVPISNVWHDDEFVVEGVRFYKGKGEYTSDFDHDVYHIMCRWTTGDRAGTTVEYPYILHDEGDFARLMSEALSFRPEEAS